jgi:N-glycosylase/DNA lyase
MNMAKMTMRTPEDFGFLPVVYSHGWYQCPPFHWDAEEKTLIRVASDASGQPVTLRIREPSRGALVIQADVPAKLTDADRRKLRSDVRRMLQLDQAIAGFHDLCRRHEHLAGIPELGAGRFLRCPSAWEELVKSICGTNVQWSQAVRMISLVAELGEPADEYHAWPTPERILEAGEETLRERCRLGYRAPYIVELAAALMDGSLDPGPIERGELERDRGLSDDPERLRRPAVDRQRRLRVREGSPLRRSPTLGSRDRAALRALR